MSEGRTTSSARLEEFVYRIGYNEPYEHLRELAQRHRGEVVVGSGIRGKPHPLAHMVSVRLSRELLMKARGLADDWDVSISDVLREALRRL